MIIMKKKKNGNNKKKTSEAGDEEYTIVNGKYGLYRRRKVKVKDVKTTKQVTVRSSLGDLGRLYSTLSHKQSGYWRMYAGMKDIREMVTKKKYLTGQTFFVSVNRNQQEIGEPIFMTFPSLALAQYLPHIEIKIVDGNKGKDIVMDVKAKMEDYTKLSIFATPAMKESRYSVNESMFRKIHVADSRFKPGDSLKQEYLKIYKTMPEAGEKIVFYVKSVNKTCGIAIRHFNIHVPVNPGE
jgi:hypothetical protein